MSAEFGLSACFLHNVAPTQEGRLAACTASGETRRQPDFQIRLLVWFKRLPPLSDWLAAFFSECQAPSTHVYSCCHRMRYSLRWSISQQNIKYVHTGSNIWNKWMEKSLIKICSKTDGIYRLKLRWYLPFLFQKNIIKLLDCQRSSAAGCF